MCAQQITWHVWTGRLLCSELKLHSLHSLHKVHTAFIVNVGGKFMCLAFSLHLMWNFPKIDHMFNSSQSYFDWGGTGHALVTNIVSVSYSWQSKKPYSGVVTLYLWTAQWAIVFFQHKASQMSHTATSRRHVCFWLSFWWLKLHLQTGTLCPLHPLLLFKPSNGAELSTTLHCNTYWMRWVLTVYPSTCVLLKWLHLQPYSCLLVKGERWGHLTESGGSIAEGSATGVPIFPFSPAVDCCRLTLMRCTVLLRGLRNNTTRYGWCWDVLAVVIRLNKIHILNCFHA